MENESEKDIDSCIIRSTQLSVSETVTVTYKGINTLIDSSLKTKDGLHSTYIDTITYIHILPKIILHKECCEIYTRNNS